VEVVAPDGTVIDEIEGGVDPPLAPGGRTRISSVLQFTAVTFPALGEYRIRLIIDGQERKVLPLSIGTEGERR
jgi:hypothetical protein